MWRILAVIFLCFCLTSSSVDAFTHGKFVQSSGDSLVTGASYSPPLDPLTTDGGDQLVTQ